jgi:hypothetical protein
MSKQNEQAVEFNQEPSQRPAEEDKEDTSGESGSALVGPYIQRGLEVLAGGRSNAELPV